MLFFFLLFSAMFLENATNTSGEGQGTGTGTCKHGACNVLMIVFGSIGAILLIAFIVVVVRYNMQENEESGPIAASLVG